MKFLRSLLLAVPFAALAMGAAYAQQATPVQQSGSRLDAAQVFFAPTPSINQAQTTITMPAVSGQCAYVDSLLVSVGQNATGATGVLTFTTTNLGGVAWSFFPVVVATSPTTPYFGQQLVGPTPFKSAACGVATTVVSPAQTATAAFPMMAALHYAP